MAKIEKVYDVSHYSNGGKMHTTESSMNSDGDLVWDGLEIWWYYDGDLNVVRTYKDDMFNGVQVEFRYLEDDEKLFI